MDRPQTSMLILTSRRTPGSIVCVKYTIGENHQQAANKNVYKKSRNDHPVLNLHCIFIGLRLLRDWFHLFNMNHFQAV